MTRNCHTIRFWRGHLPHWEVIDGRYFVTLRLAGVLPADLQSKLNNIMRDVNNSGLQNKSRKYFQHMEAWLDHDQTCNVLTEYPEVAKIITTAFFEYEHRTIWQLHSYVLMPNHLHCFFTPIEQSMTDCMFNFKRYTTRLINTYMGTTGKRFWQRKWFDHWSRSEQEDEKIINYIRHNPVKAGLVQSPEQWPYLR